MKPDAKPREGGPTPMEAVGLALALLLPSYFNARSTFSFEPDRMTLLRVLAVALVVACFVGGTARRLRLTPLRLAVCAWLAWQGVATLASVDVGRSLWGSEERAGGLLTAAAWAALALCLPTALAAEGAIHRFIVAVSLGSLPVALYALAQRVGWDPVRLADAPAQPAPAITSTLGNPVFLGGYLAMTLPLTLWLAWSARRKAAPLALALLQGAALIATEARGPWLGLAAGGVTAMLLIGIVSGRRRWVRGALATLAVGIVLLLASGLPFPGGVSDALRRLPYFGRLAGLWSGTTAAQRFLIWEGAARLTLSDPIRALLGYGPETLNLTYARVYPPRLAEYEPDGYVRLPDRAHNLAWDALAEGGLLGLVAALALWGAAVWTGLRRLNVLRPDDRLGFGLTVALAGVAGSVLASTLMQDMGAAGLGLGLGLWFGAIAWLGARGWRGAGAPAVLSREQGLLIALLAALSAHFVDMQFGFATAATGSLFWLCLAALDALTIAERERTAVFPPPSRKKRMERSPIPEATDAVLPWLAGCALLAFGFGLTSSGGLAALPLLVLTWSLLATWSWGITGRLDLAWWSMAGLAPTALALLATLAANAGAWGGLASLLLFYLGVLAGLAVPITAFGRLREAEQGRARWLRRGAWLAVGLLAVLIPLRLNAADVLHKTAVLTAREGDATSGLHWLARATAWNPTSDTFRYSRARLLAFQAQTPDLPMERARALWQEGAQELERGWKAHPRVAAYAGWLAEHHRWWAEVDDPDAHMAAAEASYRKGLEAFPNNVEWWARLGDALRRQGKYQEAAEALAVALSRAPRYYPAYLGQGDLLKEQGEAAQALEAYRRAVAVAPWAPETHLALAQALANEGQRDEALAEARAALQLAADHPARGAAAELIAALEGGDGR